jgi:hypothetical protein
MIDDHNLARVAAVFKAAAGAFRAVELPHRQQPLQQNGAAHARLQFFDVLIVPTHGGMLLSGLAGQAG